MKKLRCRSCQLSYCSRASFSCSSASLSSRALIGAVVAVEARAREMRRLALVIGRNIAQQGPRQGFFHHGLPHPVAIGGRAAAPVGVARPRPAVR